jgi:ribonuclease VapC
VIVDSSALVAVLTGEPGHEPVLEALLAAPRVDVGAPTAVETGVVLSARLGELGRSLLSRLLEEARIEVVPFTGAHLPVALSAWSRFGKGRHPAALNFGDCLTYAVAHIAGRPLLCLGDDFSNTDLALVDLT